MAARTLASIVVLVTLVTFSTSCASWRLQAGPPASVVERSEKPPRVRCILRDGRAVTVGRAEVVGDSLVGYQGIYRETRVAVAAVPIVMAILLTTGNLLPELRLRVYIAIHGDSEPVAERGRMDVPGREDRLRSVGADSSRFLLTDRPGARVNARAARQARGPARALGLAWPWGSVMVRGVRRAQGPARAREPLQAQERA